MSDAGYSLYELLATLVERVAWPSEQEKGVALHSIKRAKEVGLWGNYANAIVCEHENTRTVYKGGQVCEDCGRTLGV